MTKKTRILQQERSDFFAILTRLTDACGVSGHEASVVAIIREVAKPFAKKITFCGQGSIIISAKNNINDAKRQTLMLDAHMDEVGLMITEINQKGYLKVIAVGGLWNHVLLAQKYFIVTRMGKKIPAVVGSIPVHIVTAKQRVRVVEKETLYLDIGCRSKSDAEKVGIHVGDIAFKAMKTFPMALPGYVCGKALDNRFSCATMLVLLKELAMIEIPLNVVFVFSCQEEVGLRGVKTAVHQVNPDLAIVVDTTVSDDQNDSTVTDGCGLGKGPIMSIADAYVNSNSKFLLYLQKIARANEIAFCYNASLGGGTNGGYVYRAHKGVTTVVLSLATRYLHSHTEVCNIDDGIQTVRLVKNFIISFNQKLFWKNGEKSFSNANKHC